MIDTDAIRIDIAASATEIEREWPYRVLAGKYDVAWTTVDFGPRRGIGRLSC